ncbi:MAG: ATP-binding protein [Candidatus Aminicenantales bacterium]
MHILDITENSIEAQARFITIRLEEDDQKDLLTMEVADDGTGMDREMTRRALDPFVTTKKTRRVGLGLPLLAEAAKAAEGNFSLFSQPGRGTRVRATFRLSHFDRKPLGDIAQTLVTLIAGHPEIDIRYIHKINRARYSLDTREIREQLEGIAVNSPEVIKFIKKNINEGLDHLRRKKCMRKKLPK